MRFVRIEWFLTFAWIAGRLRGVDSLDYRDVGDPTAKGGSDMGTMAPHSQDQREVRRLAAPV